MDASPGQDEQAQTIEEDHQHEHGVLIPHCSGSPKIGERAIVGQRHGQQLAAYGPSDHYRQIFSPTRLDEAITIHDDEAECWRRLERTRNE